MVPVSYISCAVHFDRVIPPANHQEGYSLGVIRPLQACKFMNVAIRSLSPFSPEDFLVNLAKRSQLKAFIRYGLANILRAWFAGYLRSWHTIRARF